MYDANAKYKLSDGTPIPGAYVGKVREAQRLRLHESLVDAPKEAKLFYIRNYTQPWLIWLSKQWVKGAH